MRIDDTRPIWIQLADSFRSRITNGTWKPGEKIPSVRDLAICLLYTSPSPRDVEESRMPSSA